MKAAERQPIGELTLFAGIFLKTWTVPDVGTLMPQHAHEFPHISLIVTGAVQIWRGDEDLGVFHAPAAVKIAAYVFHKFLTLTSNTIVACIHAVGDGEDVSIAADHLLELED